MQLLSRTVVKGDTRRPLDALAVASLVLSILWLYGVGSLLGAVLGLVALRRLPPNAPTTVRRGRRLAIAGVVLGIVGVVLTVIAIAALFRAVSGLEYPM